MFEDLKNKKQSIVVILVLLVVISFWSGSKYTQWRLIEEPIIINKDSMVPEVKPELLEVKEKVQIFVHIAGEVKSPGIYKMEEGARLEDALCLAVPTELADIDTYLNRAAILHDQDKIIVYPKGEINEALPIMANMPPVSTMSTKSSSGKININKADMDQLNSLAGIGAVKAQAIMDYRASQGGFRSIEEIMNVKGIGQVTFDKIKDRITI